MKTVRSIDITTHVQSGLNQWPIFGTYISNVSINNIGSIKIRDRSGHMKQALKLDSKRVRHGSPGSIEAAANAEGCVTIKEVIATIGSIEYRAAV